MAAAAYTGERKRPKEMTLPMMPTTLRAASGEIILLAASGWGTHLGLVWIGRRTRRKGGRERAKAIEIWESVEVEGLAYIDRRGGGAVFIRSRVRSYDLVS